MKDIILDVCLSPGDDVNVVSLEAFRENDFEEDTNWDEHFGQEFSEKLLDYALLKETSNSEDEVSSENVSSSEHDVEGEDFAGTVVKGLEGETTLEEFTSPRHSIRGVLSYSRTPSTVSKASPLTSRSYELHHYPDSIFIDQDIKEVSGSSDIPEEPRNNDPNLMQSIEKTTEKWNPKDLDSTERGVYQSQFSNKEKDKLKCSVFEDLRNPAELSGTITQSFNTNLHHLYIKHSLEEGPVAKVIKTMVLSLNSFQLEMAMLRQRLKIHLDHQSHISYRSKFS